MKKISLILIGLVVIFTAAATLHAKECDSGQGKKWKEHAAQAKEHMAKELNLTAEQEQKLEENRQAHQEEMKKLRETIREKETKLQEALASPAITRAALNSIANEIKTLQAQLIDKRIDSIFAVEQILTPEQFAKFQQMTKDWQEKRKDRRHKQQEKKEKKDTKA